MNIDLIENTKIKIDTMISDKFNLSKGFLGQKIHRLGRRLPLCVAEDVAYLEKTLKRIAHSCRQGQLDSRRIDSRIRAHCKALNRVCITNDSLSKWLNWLGVLMMNLMVFDVLYFALLK